MYLPVSSGQRQSAPSQAVGGSASSSQQVRSWPFGLCVYINLDNFISRRTVQSDYREYPTRFVSYQSVIPIAYARASTAQQRAEPLTTLPEQQVNTDANTLIAPSWHVPRTFHSQKMPHTVVRLLSSICPLIHRCHQQYHTCAPGVDGPFPPLLSHSMDLPRFESFKGTSSILCSSQLRPLQAKPPNMKFNVIVLLLYGQKLGYTLASVTWRATASVCAPVLAHQQSTISTVPGLRQRLATTAYACGSFVRYQPIVHKYHYPNGIGCG
jgi:hypothetical protein